MSFPKQYLKSTIGVAVAVAVYVAAYQCLTRPHFIVG